MGKRRMSAANDEPGNGAELRRGPRPSISRMAKDVIMREMEARGGAKVARNRAVQVASVELRGAGRGVVRHWRRRGRQTGTRPDG